MLAQEYLAGAEWLRNLARYAEDAMKPDLLFLAEEFDAAAKRFEETGQDGHKFDIIFPK